MSDIIDGSRFGNWMISYKGRRLYPLDLRPEDIDIEEIAHSLSNLCRFGGHCKQFYSVAQHSVLVSNQCSPENRLVGLLHDATEAYCGDIVRPLKQHLPGFGIIENGVWTAIAAKFEIPFAIPEEIAREDARALLAEKRDLLTHHEHKWEFPQCAFPDLIPNPETIEPWPPRNAESVFLSVFETLSFIKRVSV